MSLLCVKSEMSSVIYYGASSFAFTVPAKRVISVDYNAQKYKSKRKQQFTHIHTYIIIYIASNTGISIQHKNI